MIKNKFTESKKRNRRLLTQMGQLCNNLRMGNIDT